MSDIRDKIKAAKDIEIEQVYVPAWDVTVEMRTPTVGARGDAMAEYMVDGEIDYVRMYPSLVIQCAYDPEDGTKLFTFDDIPWLSDKSAAALEVLGSKAIDLAGLRDAVTRIEAGKVGSTTTPSDEGSTSSPNDSA